ncbi:MAG: heavy metal translocating P-type ATPase metal-binding domain-containing protein [Nonlabens sp.]
MENCYHCGDLCQTKIIKHDDKNFCCHGCKTVYDILNDNDLAYYYEIEKAAGKTPRDFNPERYDFLNNDEVKSKLLEFDEQSTQIVSFVIPHIHCSSCIWVLENLNKIHHDITTAQVDFPRKKVRISYNSDTISLKEVVVLLSRIGYEPTISLQELEAEKSTTDWSLIYKLGVAGFAFGNIMFLSFPEYFEVEEFWLDQFKSLFRWLMFAFSVPVVFYSGRDYFVSAYKGLRSGLLNIDVPIALGISVLFIRSSVEIGFGLGTGFFDSLAGLVFFLLLGKFFQQKTYAFLSFERDYKSYFPIAVTQIIEDDGGDPAFAKADPIKNLSNARTKELQTPVYELKKGDRILIRSGELIPTDGIILKGDALIDYSFVTGEAVPISKQAGDKIFAGGKQLEGAIEIEVLKKVEQSYLTQLWNNEVFDKSKETPFKNLTDKISKRFTIAISAVAIVATIIWLFIDVSIALNVFTAVLIVACPCAIALAAPFTLGNMLRIYGKLKVYLKESHVIEQLAEIDMIVFDKTGTLTTQNKDLITYKGIQLNEEEIQLLKTTLRASNHPLSRALYDLLRANDICELESFEEHTGKGIIGTYGNKSVKVGGKDFVGALPVLEDEATTKVHISSNDCYKGCYVFYNNYREGIEDLLNGFSNDIEVAVLSGDNDGEEAYLKSKLPYNSKLLFNQKPDDKLQFIKDLQNKGKKVMMVGDGLNDAGALAQSDVGIAVSEDVNVFSPACDGIIDASKLKNLDVFLRLSKKSVRVIKYAFVFSLFYNLVGLAFAVTGNLAPVVAAILMPLSSISIVVFTTVYTYFMGRHLK